MNSAAQMILFSSEASTLHRSRKTYRKSLLLFLINKRLKLTLCLQMVYKDMRSNQYGYMFIKHQKAINSPGASLCNMSQCLYRLYMRYFIWDIASVDIHLMLQSYSGGLCHDQDYWHCAKYLQSCCLWNGYFKSRDQTVTTSCQLPSSKRLWYIKTAIKRISLLSVCSETGSSWQSRAICLWLCGN